MTCGSFPPTSLAEMAVEAEGLQMGDDVALEDGGVDDGVPESVVDGGGVVVVVVEGAVEVVVEVGDGPASSKGVEVVVEVVVPVGFGCSFMGTSMLPGPAPHP